MGKNKSGQNINESDPRQFVKNAINSNIVVCFAGTNDSFSLRALSALRRCGVKRKRLSAVYITGHVQEDIIRDIFLDISDGRSIPRVFVKGKFIGGASDLEFLEMTGELETLLREAKAYKKQKPL